MTDIFAAPEAKDQWSTIYRQKVLDDVRKEEQHKLDILTTAIQENWTLAKLMRNFPEDIILHIRDNSSGIDVANLCKLTVEEWTW